MLKETIKEALVFTIFLMSPAIIAFVCCLVRGIKAEVRERRERKESAIYYA